jgi:hypothetical protein
VSHPNAIVSSDRLVPQAKVCAAEEALVDLGSSELVEAKPLAAQGFGRSRTAQRQLHSAFQPKPQALSGRQRQDEAHEDPLSRR